MAHGADSTIEFDRTHAFGGIESKLTLVSAPAGFGKTTLLTEWLATAPTNEMAICWVSLDQNDNDSTLFWSYLIEALQNAQLGIGQIALSSLQSPQPQPIESVLTTLINELNNVEKDIILVLDDYHVIEAKPIHSALIFLLNYLPHNMDQRVHLNRNLRL